MLPKNHINTRYMMKIYLSSLIAVLLFWSGALLAQTVTPEKIITPVAFDVFDLSKATPIPPGYRDQSWKERVIPNKDNFLEEFKIPSTHTGPDPVLQDFSSAERTTAVIDKNFNGQINTSGVAPPDTHGDVSPNYYMQMVNLSFQIFDKNGNSLYGPYANSTLWSGFNGPWTGTNDGDPIILYDQAADRWIASQFALPNYPSGPFYELIAVSQTNDPRGTWYRYAYEFSSMPDYPKFGIWPDGYYMTINRFSPPNLGFAGAAVCVFNRDAMLTGNSSGAVMVSFNLSVAYGSLLPADFDGTVTPPAGSPNYLANLGTNSLRLWQAQVNWTNTASSTLTLTQSIPTQSFSYSGITINQPGTSQTLDPLSSRLMYRLQYRKFSEYEAMVTNHTVNANGAGQAGVRWYELRKYPNQSWTIYQQGTFAPADGVDRWMASVAMNVNGDIGIGYSASSSSVYPSIRFAGRSATSTLPLGQLDVTEQSIYAGTSSQTGVNRWGDYSMMSVDPVNDLTFWYTTEYSNGGWNWKTRIASFNIGTPPVGDPPVANFSGTPLSISTGGSVAFTDLSTNNPTSWSWSFPGGTPSSSTAQNPVVTYNTSGTHSVTLTASNASGSDVETKTNYITVASGPVPVANFSAFPTSITAGQSVTFTDLSSNSPTGWSWTFNGGTPSTSNAQNPVITYNSAGNYSVTLVASNANGSSQPVTQTNIITVTASPYCSSYSNSNASDWISQVIIGSNPAYSNGASTYYMFPSGPSFNPGNYSIRLTPNTSSRREYWRIWIDFNGDNDFLDAGEQVFAANNVRKPVNGAIIIPPGFSGNTRMRISMKFGGIPTPCENFTNGEVEDYPVVLNSTSAPSAPVASGDAKLILDLYPNPANDLLNVKVTSPSSKINVKLYSVMGIILRDFDVTCPITTVDLNGLAKGIYYIGVDDGTETALKKFIKE